MGINAPPNEIELVYSYLLSEFMRANRENEQSRYRKVDIAIELFEELWPEDTNCWKARIFSSAGETR